jgi:excisionase family DNA binding protein
MSSDRQVGIHLGPLDRADRLLTKLEAAELLNVRPRFIERCIAQRRIRFVRVGRFVRVPESAIQEFVTAGVVEVSDPAAYVGAKLADQATSQPPRPR